ncbi:hypothetical protein ACIQUQ_19745 [Streptomyces sp. NPDC101118]|uniref:hypothetical protein n=1 Tax=Streptomyces sp. NPDC101118 TaxID=3366109 RepID=UPI00383017B9
MSTPLVDDMPDGLTRRARAFIGRHGVRGAARPVEDHRQWWLERDVPAAVVDRMAAFQARWGGLLLPPVPQYDGGPRHLDPDSPEQDPAGWWFEAGTQRTAVPYAFLVGPSGEFGIQGDEWAPLHATVEGWVESLALAHDASQRAKQITRLVGDDVDGIDGIDGIDLSGHEPVREVRGLADTWWRGPDSLVCVYSGEATAMAFPRGRVALVCSGLADRGLRGGVDGDA